MSLVLKCPICSSTNYQCTYSDFSDDRFGCPDLVDINVCNRCGHGFISPELVESQIRVLYETYYGRRHVNIESIKENAFMEVSRSKLYRWIIGTNNTGQYFVKPGTESLDVGSGDCQSVLEAIHLGVPMVGLDVDSTSAEIGRLLNLKIFVDNGPENTEGKSIFSWIQLNQVIEHYVDPIGELKKLYKLLDKDGSIFISTPNRGSLFRKIFGRKWINWHVPYHQQHFSRNSLKIALKQAGFDVTYMKTRTPLVWSQIQIVTAFKKNETGKPSKVWNVSNLSQDKQVLQRVQIFAKSLTLFKFFASVGLIIIGRLVDVFGFGDSLVIVAKSTK